MNAVLNMPQAEPVIPREFLDALACQRAAHQAHPMPSYGSRKADLEALARMLKDNQESIIAAINADYGSRSTFEILFAELFVVLDTIRSHIKHLKGWMKPQKRKTDITLYFSSHNRVIPQPLGVVGVIVPWNFPINLTFSPLAAIFAAGNRAMVKMSENSQNLAQLLIDLTPKYFSPDKLQIFADGGGRGPAFSSLPFDHLFFTGSGQTGRAVMANAAKNLTPVTLELGGKSPAIVAPDFPIAKAAERIMWVKAFNAGQVCVNVDYAFIPAGSEAAFEREAQRLIARRYPDINHPDYTSIIDERSYQRLQAMLEDAKAKGGRIVNLFSGQKPDAGLRKFPITLVFNVRDDMQVMQREIFGPILPIKTYQSADEVVRHINSRDRPLSVCPFTHDRKLQDFYINHTMSGGMSINNAMIHAAQHDIPFGGVGPSGMGHYHGYEGFLNFSKLRPIFYQGWFSSLGFMLPPYDKGPNKLMQLLIKLKG